MLQKTSKQTETDLITSSQKLQQSLFFLFKNHFGSVDKGEQAVHRLGGHVLYEHSLLQRLLSVRVAEHRRKDGRESGEQISMDFELLLFLLLLQWSDHQGDVAELPTLQQRLHLLKVKKHGLFHFRKPAVGKISHFVTQTITNCK